MNVLAIRSARVLTMGGRPGPRRGHAMRDLGVLDTADVFVHAGRILAIARPGETPDALRSATPAVIEDLDAHGRVLMPGLVDCHTHMCWGGGPAARVAEWERLLAGDSYQQIAAAGGGIMSSVRATRDSTVGELACDLLGRADRAMACGTTTIEVKTGYGLSLDAERRMLDAVREGSGYFAGTLVPTLLLGHAIDPEFPGGADAFVDHVTTDILPALAPAAIESCARVGARPCVDAFCERSAWSPEQCARLFTAAKSAGLGVRVHADQFTVLGMVETAARTGAVSVDHLETSGPDQARALANSSTIGVILPACGLHLDGRYAKARPFIDAGAALAVATNMNPGSAPTPSLPLAMALAVRFGKMTPAEAISAATVNAAAVLGLSDRGYIAEGARADLLLLDDADERLLVYELGSSNVATLIVAGRIIEP